MEQREKLIELLDGLSIDTHDDVISVVDWLIANGVVVLPCRCGECEHKDNELLCPSYHVWFDNRDNWFCADAKRKDDIVDLCTTGHLHLGYVEEKGGE